MCLFYIWDDESKTIYFGRALGSIPETGIHRQVQSSNTRSEGNSTQSQSWVSLTLVHFGAPFPETSSTKTADSTLPLNFFKLLVQWLRTTLRTTYLHPRPEILRWEYYNPQFREGAMEIQSESVHKSWQEIGRGMIPTTIQASCLQVPGFLHCTMLLFKSMKISIFLRLHSWRDKSLLPYLR